MFDRKLAFPIGISKKSSTILDDCFCLISGIREKVSRDNSLCHLAQKKLCCGATNKESVVSVWLILIIRIKTLSINWFLPERGCRWEPLSSTRKFTTIIFVKDSPHHIAHRLPRCGGDESNDRSLLPRKKWTIEPDQTGTVRRGTFAIKHLKLL